MAVDLREYYGNVKDLGVFATVHNQVQVDVTVYSRLRIRDEKTIAFTMPNRLTHHNLQSCNHAAYLIKEQGPGYTHPYYPPFMFAEPPSSKRGFVISSFEDSKGVTEIVKAVSETAKNISRELGYWEK